MTAADQGCGAVTEIRPGAVNIGTAGWTVDGPDPLRWRLWDGQYLVYHGGSGDTHVLDVVAGEALRAVQEQAGIDAATVARQVAAVLDLPADGDLTAQMARLLDDLWQRGLIEPMMST
jgi:PqqD family protein of HPr-rel-A system